MCASKILVSSSTVGLLLIALGTAGVVVSNEPAELASNRSAVKQNAPASRVRLPANQTISVSDGRLSVALNNAPFRSVMAVISQESGIDIRVLGKRDPRPLTDTFDDLPVEDGLRRLLKGNSQGHMLRYAGRAPDRRLKQVFVLSDEGQQPAFEPPEPNIQTDEPPVELQEPGAQTDESAAEPAQPDAQTGEPAATPGAETPR
jgi:hypothetical protein